MPDPPVRPHGRVGHPLVSAGPPAASGLGRGAVDPERHGDDVGRDPQELEVSGVDAPVVVQIGDHIRRIIEDAVVIEVVDDRDGERGVDILAGNGRTHDPGVPQLGLLGVPVGDAGEVEQVGQVGARAGEARKGVVGCGCENDQAGHAVVLAGREGTGNGGTLLCTPGPVSCRPLKPAWCRFMPKKSTSMSTNQPNPLAPALAPRSGAKTSILTGLARCEAPVELAGDVPALAAAVTATVAPTTMATVATMTIRLLFT